MQTAEKLFFHGGPGINSVPEQQIVFPYLKKQGRFLHCWSEPSRLRPNGDKLNLNSPFMSWYQSAENYIKSFIEKGQKVHLIAHSFSALPICYLAQKYQKHIRQLTLISPILDINTFNRRMIELSIADWSVHKSADAIRLSELKELSESSFDSPIETALETIYFSNQASRLFFEKQTTKTLWHFYLHQSQNLALDQFNWRHIMKDYCSLGLSTIFKSSLDIPTWIIKGERDQLCETDELEYFGKVNFHHAQLLQIRNCSHYVHLEDPRFLVNCEIAFH